MRALSGDGALVLADGRVFRGTLFGGGTLPLYGEVVFATGMAGYQEVLTDPSYAGQMVAMAYPLVGNTGLNDEDAESRRPWVSAFLVRERQETPSHWQAREPLHEYLARYGVPGLEGFDTRALVRHIREHGTMRGVLVSAAALPADEASADGRHDAPLEQVEAEPAAVWAARADAWRMPDVVGQTTCETAYELDSDGTHTDGPRVVVVDYGAKGNIAREVARRGCRVRVVPARTAVAEILAWEPDGVVLSNGPGDPEDVGYGVDTVRGLLGRVPLFGICLGHQLLGLAVGGRTARLKFGHRGVNHPVHDEESGESYITTHNHGYAVLEESLPDEVRVTHRHLHDGCVEGLAHKTLPAWSVQFHPEAAPGPHEAHRLFDAFFDRVRTSAATHATATKGDVPHDD